MEPGKEGLSSHHPAPRCLVPKTWSVGHIYQAALTAPLIVPPAIPNKDEKNVKDRIKIFWK